MPSPLRSSSFTREHGDRVRKKGVLAKRVCGQAINWYDRFVTLSDESIYTQQDEQSARSHAIDLLSIAHVRRVSGHDPSSTKSGRRRFSITASITAEAHPAAETEENRAGKVHRLQWDNAFEIYVDRQCMTFYFRARSSDECDKWVAAINEAKDDAEEAQRQRLTISRGERARIFLRHMYEHHLTQGFVSAMLLANFIMSIIQGELGVAARESLSAQQLLETLDLVDMIFTFVYTAELLICLYCTPWQEFFTSAWCWFDLIIVAISLVDNIYLLAAGGDSSGNPDTHYP